MTAAKIATLLTISAIAVPAAGYVAKLVGDTYWVNEEHIESQIIAVGEKQFVTGEAYQQEKLYDLQDEAFEYELQEKYEGELTPRQKEELDRLMKRIQRLELQIQQ